MSSSLIKEKILIIDDEVDFCHIMKNYFLNRGYEVSIAYNLKQGTQLVADFNPGILFLDNNLPDGEGWDSVEKFVELIPQIRVYLVSAHRHKATYMGKHENIMIWEKPISLQQLNSTF